LKESIITLLDLGFEVNAKAKTLGAKAEVFGSMAKASNFGLKATAYA